MELSDKQKRFCEEYLIDFNGAQAAIRSGYAESSAKEQASRMLTKDNVQEYIRFLQNETSNRLEITKERVIMEYARIAFADIRKAFDENSFLKPIQSIDDDTAAALAGIQSDELWGMTPDGKERIGDTRKIKMIDKKGALDSLCKVFGWNAADKIDLTTKGEMITPVIKLPDGTTLEI